MKTIDKIILFLIGLVAVFCIGYVAIHSIASPATVPGKVGVAPGPENYTKYYYYNGLYADMFIQGGAVKSFTATSTQAAYTLTQADLSNNHLVYVNATSSPALTFTLPASSTLTTLIKSPGDEFEFLLYNANTGAATTTTVVGGAGTTLNNSSTTCAVAAAKTAVVRLFRLPTTNIVATCGVQAY